MPLRALCACDAALLLALCFGRKMLTGPYLKSAQAQLREEEAQLHCWFLKHLQRFAHDAPQSDLAALTAGAQHMDARSSFLQHVASACA